MTTKSGQTELSIEMLERMAQVLKLLAHPQRLRIIDYLDRKDEAPVHEIMHDLDLPQAITSHYLGQMRRIGLIRSLRKGREVWYQVDDRRALTILDCMRKKSTAA
jgi:ArsR family transcriptional regulator